MKGEKSAGNAKPRFSRFYFLVVIILICVSIFATLLSIYSSMHKTPEQNMEGKLSFCYYYFNPCESCNEFDEFVKRFVVAANEVSENYPYTMDNINGINDNYSAYDQVCEKLGIVSDHGQRMLVCGNRWLTDGIDDVQALKEFFSSCVQDNNFQNQIAEPSGGSNRVVNIDIVKYPELQELNSNDSYLLFFKTAVCENCESVKSFLEKMPKSMLARVDVGEIDSKIIILEYLLTDDKALDLAYYLFDRFEVPVSDRKVPIVFYSGGYLSGKENIQNSINDMLHAGKALGFSLDNLNFNPISLSWRDVPAVFVAGLVGGLNPCSISMLFLLMSILTAKQVNVLKLGFLYISAKTITYFILGTALSSLLMYLGSTIFTRLTSIVNLVVAGALLVLVALNLYDYFAAKNEKYGKIKNQLPKGLRKFNHTLIEKATSGKQAGILYVAVFVLGIFISMGEFLCTGQIYLATILYLMEKTTRLDFTLLAMFGLYVVAMAIPPAILTLLIYKGRRIIILSEGVRKNLTTIKLLSSAILFIIAVFIILKTI